MVVGWESLGVRLLGCLTLVVLLTHGYWTTCMDSWVWVILIEWCGDSRSPWGSIWLKVK